MKMPQIRSCTVTDCAYNYGNTCHAMAITMGDKNNPVCKTFCRFITNAKGGDSECKGKIGACKISRCIFNTCLECQAKEVFIGSGEQGAQCLTFQSSQAIKQTGSEISSAKHNSDLHCDAPEVFIG